MPTNNIKSSQCLKQRLPKMKSNLSTRQLDVTKNPHESSLFTANKLYELITVILSLSLHVRTVICPDWLHDVFLNCVSSCSSLTVMWCTSARWRTGIFSLWQHRVGDSLLISTGVAAATTVWSLPGQVAPVTLHCPFRTKHCAHVTQLPPWGTSLALST